MMAVVNELKRITSERKTRKEMDATKNINVADDMDRIYTILKLLKNHIDRHGSIERDIDLEEESMKNQRIKKLAIEEKRLSMQFHNIVKEVKNYEESYEQALQQKVKLMRNQIKEQQIKLSNLKQKYKALGVQLSASSQEHPKQSRQSKKLVSIKKVKHNYNPKATFVKNKFRIKLKKNAKLRKHTILFLNGNGNSLTNAVKPVSKTVDTRDCKIVLQRLTEEQMRQYITNTPVSKERRKNVGHKSTESSQAGVSEVNKVMQTWQIRIPREVLEESEILNEGSNTY